MHMLCMCAAACPMARTLYACMHKPTMVLKLAQDTSSKAQHQLCSVTSLPYCMHAVLHSTHSKDNAWAHLLLPDCCAYVTRPPISEHGLQ